MASGTVGTEANTVVGPTEVCLVFGMAGHGAEFLVAMGELTFVTVFASAVLLEGTTHLSFVSVGVLDGSRGHGGALGGSLALAAGHQGSSGSWAIPVKAGQGISQGGRR